MRMERSEPIAAIASRGGPNYALGHLYVTRSRLGVDSRQTGMHGPPLCRKQKSRILCKYRENQPSDQGTTDDTPDRYH